MKTPRRYIALVAAVASVLTLLATSPAGSSAAGSCSDSELASTPLAGFSADAHPVVLVHGWNGSGDDIAPVAKALTGLPVSTYLFDYHAHRGDWAAEQPVSGCLAEYVGAASAGHMAAGGDGKVIVIGHSMGGLAARFASDATYAANPIDDVLGGVVTIDTPHLGSPFGDVDLARAAGAVLGSRLDDLLFAPPPGSDAAVCLAEHSPPDHTLPDECDVAPYLPAATPLSQLAGSVGVRRTLFGVPLYTIPLASDGIVPVESSHGYLNSATGGRAPRRPAGSLPLELPTISCRVDFDQVAKVAAAQGLLQGGLKGGLAGLAAELSPNLFSDEAALDDLQDDQLGPELVAFLAAANLVAPCSHSGMLTDERSLAAVRTAVSRDIEHLNEAAGEFTVLTGPTAGFGEFRERIGYGEAVPALIDAFGEPDSTTSQEYYRCELTWEDIGAVVTVGVFGSDPSDPCEGGVFLSAKLMDPRWRTKAGIGPGSSAADARAVATKDCTAVVDYASGCGAEPGYTYGLHQTDCASQDSPNVTAETDGTEPVRSLIVYWHGCE